ncbi:hypothetical protein [Xenorhabdus ishibashii]|nr:hypothetical protein [Xenorhabdus ishibashii]
MSSSTQQPERLVRMMVMMVKLNTVHIRVLYFFYTVVFYKKRAVLNNGYT